MSSGAPGAMESLKSRIPRKSRKGQHRHHPQSRVQQFYDEFESSHSSHSESGSDDADGDKGTFFGYRNRPRAPMIRPISANRPLSSEYNQKPESTPSDDVTDPSSVTSSKGGFQFPESPISPGLSKNQDIKDSALNVIFQKRIKELKSKL